MIFLISFSEKHWDKAESEKTEQRSGTGRGAARPIETEREEEGADVVRIVLAVHVAAVALP